MMQLAIDDGMSFRHCHDSMNQEIGWLSEQLQQPLAIDPYSPYNEQEITETIRWVLYYAGRREMP